MSQGISETEHCGYFITGHQEGEADTIYLKGWDLQTKKSLSLQSVCGERGQLLQLPLTQSQAVLDEPVAVWTGKLKPSAPEPGHIREMTPAVAKIDSILCVSPNFFTLGTHYPFIHKVTDTERKRSKYAER